MRSSARPIGIEARMPHVATRARCLGLILLAPMFVVCRENPKEPLFIVGAREFGAGELRGATVRIDGELIGTLEPLAAGSWMQWLADWIGFPLEDAILDGAFVLEFDLGKVERGSHTVMVETPGVHVFTREFEHPDDLTEDGIWVHVGNAVNLSGCSILVPPLLDCAQRPLGKVDSPAANLNTVCRLSEELKGCLGHPDWAAVEGIEVCQSAQMVQVTAVLEDHSRAGAAVLNADTAEVACETY